MKKKSSLLSLSGKLLPDEGVRGEISIVYPLSLLFILSVVYFYFFGSGLLFHQENNILFVFSADYLRNFTDKPGGLLVYSGNFLTQFYFNPLLGSIIISTFLVLISIVLNGIIRILNARKSFSLLFVLIPVSVLMLLQSRYDFQMYHIIGFLLILTWFRFSIATVNPLFRLSALFLFPILYYVAGSFAIVYLGLYISYSVFYQKGNSGYFLTALLMGIAVISFVFFRNGLFLQPAYKLLSYPLFLNYTLRLTICLAIFSGFIIIYPFLIKVTGSTALNKKLERYISLLTVPVILPVIILIWLLNYDSERARIMDIEKMVYRQSWDEVIRQHEKSPSSNIVEQYYYNLALSEKGQLCSRMFFGPQSYGAISLTLKRDDEQSFRAMYFYYAVGLTGEAHHLAYELMVQHGYRPETIKMLIKTELINGNFKIAERYINVLKKTIHYKKWAEKYEKMLNKAELVSSDQELGEKVRLMPVNDFFVFTDDFRNLETLLQGNPGNRIAFEYKMARLLLEKDIMAVGSEIKNLKGLKYTHIPRHIEEALVSLVNITGEFPDLGGLSVSADTEQRFFRYFSNLKSSKSKGNLIEKGISKVDRNTFWHYLQFGVINSDFFRGGHVDENIY